MKYWISKKQNQIPKRITNECIWEALEFILKNNNFSFNWKMFNQILWTAVGTKHAPPNACLTTGYEEEESLFKMELPKHFNMEAAELIKIYFKGCINDGFHLSQFSFKHFIICSNNLHLSKKFTFEKAESLVSEREKSFKN